MENQNGLLNQSKMTAKEFRKNWIHDTTKGSDENIDMMMEAYAQNENKQLRGLLRKTHTSLGLLYVDKKAIIDEIEQQLKSKPHEQTAMY